jgi:lysophospholipase L1-like esterase
MLGTNDTKYRFSACAYDIGLGLDVLVDEIRGFPFREKGENTPAILIVSPPPILSVQGTPENFIGASEKSNHFPEVFKKVAEKKDCLFFNAGQIISSSRIDGLHFSAESHRKLGRALAHYLVSILQERTSYGHSLDR